ncbi:MAG: hypothetical protein IJ794_03620, partial [Lachnospiraceae bacterium]|nr:hypothetical protein [Lachnospiraceae bacterium]
MKLKYYLRGLATGLVVATLIITIANRDNKPFTDAQVRQRAMELGMVDGDSLKLSSLQSSQAESAGAQSEPSQGAEKGTESSTTTSESGTASESSAVTESSAATESSAVTESSAATESSAVTESSAATE